MTSSRYDGPVPGDPEWEAADIRGDVWVDEARERMQAEAEERFAAAERDAGETIAQSWAGAHRYVDSSSTSAALARAWHEESEDAIHAEDENDDEAEATD